MSHQAGMAFPARYAFAPFGGHSGRVRPAADSAGSAYARRDVRYRIVTSGSGFLGFPEGLSGVLPRFTRPIYAAVRLLDPISANRSSRTSATSAQAPSAGETAAAPAASAAWRIRSAKRPGASRYVATTTRGAPSRSRPSYRRRGGGLGGRGVGRPDRAPPGPGLPLRRQPGDGGVGLGIAGPGRGEDDRGAVRVRVRAGIRLGQAAVERVEQQRVRAEGGAVADPRPRDCGVRASMRGISVLLWNAAVSSSGSTVTSRSASIVPRTCGSDGGAWPRKAVRRSRPGERSRATAASSVTVAEARGSCAAVRDGNQDSLQA